MLFSLIRDNMILVSDASVATCRNNDLPRKHCCFHTSTVGHRIMFCIFVCPMLFHVSVKLRYVFVCNRLIQSGSHPSPSIDTIHCSCIVSSSLLSTKHSYENYPQIDGSIINHQQLHSVTINNQNIQKSIKIIKITFETIALPTNICCKTYENYQPNSCFSDDQQLINAINNQNYQPNIITNNHKYHY